MLTDRRIAELTGNLRAISDEMQEQIRRVDSMERRFWELRSQTNERIEHRCSELNRSVQRAFAEASSVQFCAKDFQEAEQRYRQRLKSLEQDADERKAKEQHAKDALLRVCARLDALSSQVTLLNKPSGTRGESTAQVSSLEKAVENMQRQLSKQEEKWQALNELSAQRPEPLTRELEDLRRELLKDCEDQCNSAAEKLRTGLRNELNEALHSFGFARGHAVNESSTEVRKDVDKCLAGLAEVTESCEKLESARQEDSRRLHCELQQTMATLHGWQADVNELQELVHTDRSSRSPDPQAVSLLRQVDLALDLVHDLRNAMPAQRQSMAW